MSFVHARSAEKILLWGAQRWEIFEIAFVGARSAEKIFGWWKVGVGGRRSLSLGWGGEGGGEGGSKRT